MDEVVFMDQVKRSERGFAESFWLALAGGVPVPPEGNKEAESQEWREECRKYVPWTVSSSGLPPPALQLQMSM